ncbi:MAG: TolC family protein [Mucinivorans sp.]
MKIIVMPKKILLLILVAFIVPRELNAQNTESAISLESALETAFMSSPTLRAAAHNQRAALFARRAAWGMHLPQLSASAEYTFMSQDIGHFDLNGAKDQLLGVIGQLPIPPQIIGALKGIDLSYTLQKRDFAVVGANLMIPIYTGGKINAVSNAGKIKFEQANIEARQAENEIFTQVSQRYWGLALSRSIESVQEQLVEAMQVHAQNAAHLEANGMIAKGERLLVEMNLAQARAGLVGAQGNTQTVNSAFGSSFASELLLKAPTVDYQPITPMFITENIESLAYFKQKVAQNSLALSQVDIIKRLAKEVVRAERADFTPQIAALGGINIWSYNLTDQLPRWFVGAGIRLNIFDGLQREYRYSAARNQVRRIEQLEVQAEIDIQVLVEKLYTELTSSIQAVKAADATIAFATEYLRVKKEGFTQGMVPASDVVDAELNLSKTRTERLAAAYRFDVALTNLLALTSETDRLANYQNSSQATIISIN